MPFAIKATISESSVTRFQVTAHKTMYGGKAVACGDTVFIFASENAGGRGLIARGTVRSAEPVDRIPGLTRQTSRVTLVIDEISGAKRPLGRADVKSFLNWNDGQPETELNFKFYRQATDKLVAISDATSHFLETFF